MPNQSLDGIVLSETAIGGPALANVYPDASPLALGWTGTDPEHHLNVAYSDDGQAFSGKITLNETSIDGPGLAFGNGSAYIAWTGTDAQHRVNVGRAGNPLTLAGFQKATLNETSSHGPVLAFGNNLLYLAWVGTDAARSLNVISSSDGVTFANKVTLRETSVAGPALYFSAGVLYLLWSGTDQQHSLNISQSTDGITFTGKITLNETGDSHPALGRLISGAFWLAWTGRDSARSLNTLHNGEFATGPTGLGHKQTYSDTSIAGPALAAIEFGHELIIGWTGTDQAHHLNVSLIAGAL